MTTASDISRLLVRPQEGSDLHQRLRIRVGDDTASTPAELLHSLVTGPDMPRSEFPSSDEVPSTVEQISAVLRPLAVAPEQIAGLMAAVCCTDLAYRWLSRSWPIEEAASAWRSALELLGDQARWWTNAGFRGETSAAALHEGLPSWDPVTTFVFDLAFVGIGADATVTVVSFADD
ncbi:hypothetical protein ACQEU3_08580 [Spirillospora sp. CA-253888]